MSKKNKKWFRSAFSQDHIQSEEEPSFKRTKSFSPPEDDNTFINFGFPLSEDTNSKPLNTSSLITVQKGKSNVQNSISLEGSNWIENFAPKSLSDLAIHPKKIQEVKDWFLHCEVMKRKYPGQMLLVVGPAGSGKTITIKTIAKSMNYEISEWINPVDLTDINDNLQDNNKKFHDFRESQTDLFRRFLFKSSRYKSVFNATEKKIVVVEDFPNVFMKDSEGFVDILECYRNYGKCPLIFIVTESKSKQLNIAHNLFPDQTIGQFQITKISFNPISITLVKKALKNICTLMSQDGFNKFYNVPNQEIIESINLASQGDIRNAIINLHFASLKGEFSKLQTEINEKRAAKKPRMLKYGKKLTALGRDESLTMMHALGRVFNPKYNENHSGSVVAKTFLHVPENLVDNFSSEPRNFVDLLHANYLQHFGSIETVMRAADEISLCDVFLGEYRDDRIPVTGLNIAVRGIMVTNENPVTGWMPIKGPKRIRKETDVLLELKSLGIEGNISSRFLSSDYKMYAKIIKK